MLNPKEFEIDTEFNEDIENCTAACKRLVDKWTPELENQMLEAFIKFYHDKLHEQWGQEINSPSDLLKHTGTEIMLYALEDAVYARSKSDKTKYESQNVDICVILVLECPWEKEHGWAAVFIDEKFVMVGTDIVDCVWLD